MIYTTLAKFGPLPDFGSHNGQSPINIVQVGQMPSHKPFWTYNCREFYGMLCLEPFLVEEPLNNMDIVYMRFPNLYPSGPGHRPGPVWDRCWNRAAN